jgi:L-ascorbate metabolism protein UlaG (beta-lactamase superfamily)
MKLTWLGHSCFLAETAEGSVLLDPYAPGSVPGLKLPKLTADLVLCSHGHRDHGYREAARLSGKPCGVRVSTLETFHDEQGGALRGPNTVHVLRAEGQTVVHLGDLGHQLTPEQAAPLRRCDVLLIPVGGTYTVDAAGARRVADALEPRIVVPMHYRRGEIGFENIGTLEEFTALFPAEQVHLLEENGFDPAAWTGVVVPKYRV